MEKDELKKEQIALFENEGVADNSMQLSSGSDRNESGKIILLGVEKDFTNDFTTPGADDWKADTSPIKENLKMIAENSEDPLIQS